MTAIDTGFNSNPSAVAATLPLARRRTPRYVHAFRALLYFALFMGVAWGGPVIRVAALCALPLALLTDWDGGVRHLLRTAGLGLAMWLAPTVGIGLGNVINRLGTLPPMLGTVAGIGLLGLGAFVVVGLLSRGINRRLRKHPHLNGLNHILGASLGAAEGVALVAVGCWVLAAFEGPLESLRYRLPAGGNSSQAWVLDTLADMRTAVRNDQTGQWLTENNLLEDLPAVQTAQLAVELSADPALILALVESGQFDHIVELPEVKKYAVAFENDPALRAAAERGDVQALLNNPQVRTMLDDQELRRVLLAHRDEIRRAVGKPDYVKLKSQARQLDPETRRRLRNLAKRYSN